MYTQHDSQSTLMQQNPQTFTINNNQLTNAENWAEADLIEVDESDKADAHLEWFEGQAGQAIAELLNQKERVIQRIKALEAEVSEIDGQISSVKTTISLFRKRSGIEPPAERQSVDPNLNAIYAGKGLKEALITFAKNNGGIINESLAIETLMNAGFYPNYKKAKASINTTLNRESNPEVGDPTFLKLDKGMYKLIGL
jgi:hypothetical protein